MKVSVNWVKEYTDVDLSVAELVTKIGAQLGAVEEVIDLSAKYQGIVIARIVEYHKHPNADKLSICKIDDGGKVENVERDGGGHVQVVCGAPNLYEGMTVAWLPSGTTVPSTHGAEPFVLEARDMRGEKSNGMLASAKELGIGDDHSGILDLEAETTMHKVSTDGEVPHTEVFLRHKPNSKLNPGDDFATTFGLNDHVLDIENKMFTHRPDCFGILGVAREIAGISGKQFTSPTWYTDDQTGSMVEGDHLPFRAENEAPELVPRFMARVVENIQVKPSPMRRQCYLARVGIKPISNVVDISNYFMHLTAQPTHAFDYDKIKAVSGDTPILKPRKARDGEEITLLGGKTIKLTPDDIVIATDQKAVALAGVMGGAETEVDEHTRNIIVECATFDMYAIRRTAMRHGLFTDAVTRYNKGQSPLQNDRVLAAIVDEMVRDTGGVPAKSVFDLKTDAVVPAKAVETTRDFINTRLGFELSAEDMARLLSNVEFGVQVDGDKLTVSAPFWRTDIEIAEDVVEEIGRLYGYNHLPAELPRRSIRPVQRNRMLDLKSKVRDVLSDAGANEALTYSFVHGDLLDKVDQDKEKAFKLSNALSPDLQYYRLSLTPSLLDKIRPNIKAGYDEFALFELGKAHNKDVQDAREPGLPQERHRLALVYAATEQAEAQGATYYTARKYLDELLCRFGIEAHYAPLNHPTDDADLLAWQAAFAPDRSAAVTVNLAGTESPSTLLGIAGEYKASVRKNFKLPRVAGFELDLMILLAAYSKPGYTPISRFPKAQQDMSLRVAGDISYQSLLDELQAGLKELTDEHVQAELSAQDIYQADTAKHVTFRLKIADYRKTLKAEEVNQLLDNLAARAKEKFGADRI